MSTSFSPRLRSAVSAVVGLLALAAPAAAADLGEIAGAVADVPACDAPSILARVRSDFAHGMANVEKRDLAIADFGRIRSQGAGANAPAAMVHRWCYAPVTLSDGRRSTAYWRIDPSQGFASPGYAGIPDGVESCVLGHDRWRVHDGTCRTVRLWW